MNAAALRVELAHRLREARAWTDSLFALLTTEGMSTRAVAERHRFIFYVGHLEAFDWNLLCRDVLGQRSSNPGFERLFAFGIDPVDGQLPSDAPQDWPSLEVITRWNRELRAAVDDALARAPLTGWLEGGWAARLAIEHRLMHAETLSYLLQRLELRFKVPGGLPGAGQAPREGRPFIDVADGVATLGLSRLDTPHLGWGNEYERHSVEVPAFSFSRLPISNAQWLEFIDAGGYRERALWSADAWAWLARDGISHPAFWRRREGRWWWRAMFGELPLPPHWPVYVSHAEASAYARWKGARLLTEPQWHRAIEDLQPLEWKPDGEANFGGHRHDPLASGARPGGETQAGAVDLIGNGWEWTQTVFAPFAGFEPLPFYKGYSADFFDGKHFVLKGASAATAATLLRPTFRNWFQPHYQHVFAKFRLVKGAPDA